MLGKTYEKQDCSAARALEIAGERWSLLILRDAIFRGTSRFSDFERSLGIAPNILARRLEGFVDGGLMRVEGEQEGKSQRRYRLTQSGRDFAPVLMALTQWGEKWVCPGPIDFVDAKTGEDVELRIRPRKKKRGKEIEVAVRLREKSEADE